MGVHINYLSKPQPCGLNTDFITLIHSAVGNSGKRSTLRSTWADKTLDKYRFVFVLGVDNSGGKPDNKEKLSLEISEHQDILQGNFVDSYRNMSTKHLPRFLGFLELPDLYYLCQVHKDNKPMREKT